MNQSIANIIRLSIFCYLIIGTISTGFSQSSSNIEQKVEDLIAWTKTSPDTHLNRAKDSLEKAKEISINHPYSHALALSEYLRFIIRKTGDFDASSEILEELSQLSNSSSDPRVKSIYHFSKGGFYIYENANRSKAMEEYGRALKILDDNNIVPDYNLLHNSAIAEMDANKIREALNLFKRAEVAYLKKPLKGDENFQTTLIMNKGVAYINLGKLDSAEFYLREAYDVSQKTIGAEDDFMALVFLGVFLQETEVYDQAITTLDKARLIINSVKGRFNDKALLFEGISDAYQKIDEIVLALEMKKLEIIYRDSLNQSGIIEKAFALDYLSEIKSLKQQKKIDDLNVKLNEQSLKTTISFVVSILILVIILSLFINYRLNKRKQLNQIKAKNEQLENERVKQEAELQLFRNEEKLIKANIELATNKTELSDLKYRLKSHLDQSFDPEFDGLKKYLSQIKASEKRTEQLKYIDHVLTYSNNEFYKKFKNVSSSVTEDQIRLATLIRLNLTSDEIASIFNISSSSLMTKRYRLRKKLNLDTKTSLNDFVKQL